ncbi:MAG TPA: gamma-glutamyltransferase [Steroidobacteraceae bacterium]
MRFTRPLPLAWPAHIAYRTLALLLVGALTACTPSRPTPATSAPASAASTSQAWVAAANPYAVEAGLEVLAKGGGAVDAAIAVQTVLGLVEPQSSGIGGGAFMLYYDASTRRIMAFNGRETAPAGARADMFLDSNGEPLPRSVATMSGRAVGVPGVMRMLELAHKQFGALPWSEAFEPAIRLAQDGFEVPKRLARFLNSGFPQANAPDIRKLFSRADGSPLQAGDHFRNPAYAETLRQLASSGASVMYEGPLAEAIVARSRAEPLGGSMTLQDLAQYRPEQSEPLCRTYRVRLVCVPPPPSSGVGLLQLLALLEHTDAAEGGPQAPEAWFAFAQASRIMYADRDRYVADPRFVPVPVEQLLDPEYVARRTKLIGERAGPAPQAGVLSVDMPGADATREAAGTSHFVIVDERGNVVSMTTTVETLFGTGRVVGGFVLNNQLTDFSLNPREDGRLAANAVAGGKRPRSSMAPVIILDTDRAFFGALGSPGGNAILAYNGKTLLGTLGWGLELQQAIELPNLLARGDNFGGEASKFPPNVLEGLAARGITVTPGRGEESGLHGVMRNSAGLLVGGADPRREGVARRLSESN